MSVDAVVLSVECFAESVGKNVCGESRWIDQWAAKGGLGTVAFGAKNPP
ncbi:hypothetical protein [Mycobacteroides sp. PCS013]